MEYKKIAVLLAAYNGRNFIEMQLESILQQKNVDVTVFISVDLSDDGTYEYCCSLAKINPAIVVLEYGERFYGAAKNFYHLFESVDLSPYDYVSISDQDDIWNRDKLLSAIDNLQSNHVYSSNVIAFWPDGRECLIDKSQQQKEFDYLFEAAGPGCTYVMIKSVAQRFKQFIEDNYNEVSQIALHDWLLYAYARNSGYSWFIDQRPSMRYRQHANNQVGANNSFAAARKRLFMIRSKWYRCEILKIVNLLRLQNSPFVKRALSNTYCGNLYLFLNVNKTRRRLRDKIAFAIVCLFGIF